MKIQPLPKQPPHSLEPEQSVLGALMVHCDKATEIFGIVGPDDFYRHDHQAIARTIRRLHEARKPHGLIEVTEAMREAGELETGGAAYIAQLAVDCYSVVNIASHAAVVRDKARRRQVIALCAQVTDAAYGHDSDDLAGMLSAGVETLLRASGSRSLKFTDLLDATESYLQNAKERRKAGGVLGVSSGLPGLDHVTGGFYGGRLYGIAARPGTGKTALLNQIAFGAAARGEPGLIASLEMGAEELTIRALSAHSRRNVTRLFHGHDEDIEAALESAVRMGDLPLWLDTETYGLNQILAQIAMHKHKHGIRWAAVDHVGLIQTERFNSRNDQIGHITGALKRCAKQLQIPIIALLQLSRTAEKEGRRPGLHDCRDSGNIEQDLDVAIFLHVDAKNRGAPKRNVEIGVLKNRNGRSAWLSECFEFDGAIQTFREIAAEPTRYAGYGDHKMAQAGDDA